MMCLFTGRSVMAALNNPLLIFSGLPFSFTLLSILLAHEMGHFLACRYYGIQCSYPHVIPAPPLLTPFGTFGAVILIKSNFMNRRQVFDVAIAGPIAGFAFLLPALAVGLRLSQLFVAGSESAGVIEFGEPVLLKLFARGFFPFGDLTKIELHPIGFAAWFGMLATAMNLLPVGQMDGGHIVYAMGGPKVHRWVSFATLAVLSVLGVLVWSGYLLFGLIVVFLAFRHPRPLVDFGGIGTGRNILAAVALLIFILTFTLIPVRFVD